MIVNLLVTLALGGIAAGSVYLIARPLGWKPPSVLYLVAAAAGMLAYSIYDEYTWYERSTASLPNRIRPLNRNLNRSRNPNQSLIRYHRQSSLLSNNTFL